MQNEADEILETESSFGDEERDEKRTIRTADVESVSLAGEVIADEVLEQEIKDLREFYWEIQGTVCNLEFA